MGQSAEYHKKAMCLCVYYFILCSMQLHLFLFPWQLLGQELLLQIRWWYSFLLQQLCFTTNNRRIVSKDNGQQTMCERVEMIKIEVVIPLCIEIKRGWKSERIRNLKTVRYSAPNASRKLCSRLEITSVSYQRTRRRADNTQIKYGYKFINFK